MKLELTAKEVKSIGQQRAMATLDKKYAPWGVCTLVVVFIGLLTAIVNTKFGGLFLFAGFLSASVILFATLWEAHKKGYEFLDAIIKGITDKEQ